ncbi:MAG: hypothetical protein BGO49_29660 [Planctomycetales bacterium 71-10]|nr:MAG: hypothetical protein BGO49_29660 [Planctomycetales bacterium 71-10]
MELPNGELDATPTTLPPPARPPEGPRGRLRPIVIAAGLVVAVLAWAIGETGIVRVPARQVPMVTMGTKHMGTSPATERTAAVVTATRGRIALGALLGLALGAAGGLAGRARSASIRGAVAGAVLGGLAAGAVTYPSVSYYTKKVETFESDLIPALALHAAIAAAIGAAAGAALGLGAGGPAGRGARWAIGGAVGGLLGALAYQVVGGILLPVDGTTDPTAATATARFLAVAFVAVGCCAGVAAATDRA